MKTVFSYPCVLGGHRGSGCTDHDFYTFRVSENIPVENTVASVLAAFEAGAAYVEIDVTETADGISIAIHNVVPDDHFFDASAKPKTEERLNKLSFDAIKNFKTGRSRKGTLARLDALLATIARHDPHSAPWAVNIEIKGVQGSGQNFEENGWLERLADTVSNAGVPVERVLFSSFAEENIIRMSHLLPRAQYGMLYAERTESRPIYADHQDDLRYCYVPFDEKHVMRVHQTWKEKAHSGAVLGFAHPEVATITDAQIEMAARYGIGLNSWSVFETLDEDRLALYRHLIAATARRGVPYTAITDYIPEMQKFMAA